MHVIDNVRKPRAGYTSGTRAARKRPSGATPANAESLINKGFQGQTTSAKPSGHFDTTVAYELQRRGWLGQLRTRNVWEFLPGARAGAYGAGDRYIELRAQLAYDPDAPFVLAMESAAVLLGLAQRLPASEVVACPLVFACRRAWVGGGSCT